MKIINEKLAYIGYKIKSDCAKTNVMIDGKRTTERAYKFELIKLFE